jgi:hypothetical protein
LVRERVRANLLAGVTPSAATIVDAACGVGVVRLHRRDIDALRQAAAAAQYSRSLRPKISETELSVSLPPGAEIRLFGGTTRTRSAGLPRRRS